MAVLSEDPREGAVLSENAREGHPSEWGVWNYAGTLTCDGHREAAENEALAKGEGLSGDRDPLNA